MFEYLSLITEKNGETTVRVISVLSVDIQIVLVCHPNSSIDYDY